MYILNSAAYYLEVDDVIENLKQEVKDSCKKHVRRIDRFIQLSLIGSHRCALEFDLPTNTGLYLSSGDGPKVNIHNSLEQIYKHQQPLMPLSFINMVSNSASYYIAHSLGIHGANIFSSDSHFSLQNALTLAELDLKNEFCELALVGTVDEVAEPLDIQRELLGIENNELIGEGSYWLLLSPNPDNAIGQLTLNKRFHSLDALVKEISPSVKTNCLLTIENNFSDNERSQIIGALEVFEEWNFQEEIAKHRGQSAYPITQYFQKETGSKILVHISKDDLGNYNLLVAEKL